MYTYYYPNSTSSSVNILMSSSIVNMASVSISLYGKNRLDNLLYRVCITFIDLEIAGKLETENI